MKNEEHAQRRPSLGLIMAKSPSMAGRPPGKFLDGNPEWWMPPIAPVWARARRKETKEEKSVRQEKIISALEDREQVPPSTCSEWRRQRLRPLAISWLFPSAYSLGFGLLAVIFLLTNRVDDVWALVTAQVGLFSCSASLVYLQWRRIGLFHGANLTLITSFSLVGTGYIGWLYIGSSTDSATILAWTLLMLTCIWFVFRGGSEVVTYDGARWLMPINSGSTVRVDGEELVWKEGRIFTEKIENETITLSVERISGVYFLVLSNSINFNIRKDPLLKNNSKSVKKRAIALMQSNSSKVGSWPSWALDESEEE